MSHAEGLTLMRLENATFADQYLHWQNITTVTSQHHQVAICGLMNAGKSSLLNMLTGQPEHEYFPTGASRTTDEVKSFTNSNIDWIDTPGIDACIQDDLTAWRSILRADTIIFTHTLRTGILEKIEIDFLNKLLQHLPDLEQRLLVVLTHADSVEEHKDESVNSITQLLEREFPSQPPLFVTSSSRFKKGSLTKKENMIRLSGINQLLTAVQSRASAGEATLLEKRARDKAQLHQKLEAAINVAIEYRENIINVLKDEQKKNEMAYRADARCLLNSLRQRIIAGKNI